MGRDSRVGFIKLTKLKAVFEAAFKIKSRLVVFIT